MRDWKKERGFLALQGTERKSKGKEKEQSGDGSFSCRRFYQNSGEIGIRSKNLTRRNEIVEDTSGFLNRAGYARRLW
jgi:hypothetical protein